MKTMTKQVVLVGDSTVQNYPIQEKLRGWGQAIEGYFVDGVAVINDAAGGRSTKTFRSENRWAQVLDRKPDYVIIQFGHNDSHSPEKPESTAAAGEYRANLICYVNEARAADIVPILVTPPRRRSFAQNQMTNELEPYTQQMRKVAAELGVGLIDLYQLTGDRFGPMGDDGCVIYYCSPEDRSHFSEKGAALLARMVVEQLPNACPELAKLLLPANQWPANH